MHFEENASEASLSEGISALKAGKKSDAERLLKLAVRQRPDSAPSVVVVGCGGPRLRAKRCSVWNGCCSLTRIMRGLGLVSVGPGASTRLASWRQSILLPTTRIRLHLDRKCCLMIARLELTMYRTARNLSPDNQPLRLLPSSQPSLSRNQWVPAFLPKLIIAGLSLTLLLGILIIIALLRAWLG